MLRSDLVIPAINIPSAYVYERKNERLIVVMLTVDSRTIDHLKLAQVHC